MIDALVPLAVIVAGPLTSLGLLAIARLTATDLRPTARPVVRPRTHPTIQPTTRRVPVRMEHSHG